MQLQVAQMIHIQNDVLLVNLVAQHYLQMINSTADLAQIATWYAILVLFVFYAKLETLPHAVVICNPPS